MRPLHNSPYPLQHDIFERESGGGSVEAVGSLEESRVAACLQQSTLWQRVVWRLIAAVGTTAEDCVVAGLYSRSSLLCEREGWRLGLSSQIFKRELSGGSFAAVDSSTESRVAADCSSWSYGRGLCGSWLGSGLFFGRESDRGSSQQIRQ